MGSFDSLRYRNYRRLWVGNLVSNVGTWMQSVALGWLVFELTRSAFWVSAVTFVNFIPTVLSPIAGALTDRFDRRRILLVAQSFMMADAALLAGLAWTGRASLAAVLLLTFGMGLGFTLNGPAWLALIPSLVPAESTVNAIALNSANYNLARVAGPALAGGLLAVTGAGPLLAINAVSFLAVLAALLALATPPDPPRPRRSVSELVVGGLQFVAGHRRIREMVILIAVVSFFAAPATALQPVFAGEVYGRGAEAYGALAGAMGAGSVAGALVLAHRQRLTPQTIALATLALGLTLAAFAGLPSFAAGVALMVGFGAAFLFVVAGSNGDIQLQVPERLRGRVVSIWMMAFGLAFPVGAVAAGVAADAFGPRTTTAIGALACVAWGARLLWVARRALQVATPARSA